MANNSCDYCAYYAYDEEYDCYFCDMNLDEDEMARFMTKTMDRCPYFRDGDEYKVVKKQN